MALEYDLIILGDTPEGRYASALAITYQARVALIRGVSSVAIDQTGVVSDSADLGDPVDLERLGVEVIHSQGVLTRVRQKLGVWVGETGRLLQGRAYLLASGALVQSASSPKISRLDEAKLAESDLSALPDRIAIAGRHVNCFRWAQKLRAAGKTVHLLLGDLDWQGLELFFQRRVLSCLEAQGIQIFAQHGREDVSEKGDLIRWSIEKLPTSPIIEADVIIDISHWLPNLTAVDVSQLSLSPESGRLRISDTLRTHHARVWACGTLLGLEGDAILRSAEVAVVNGLLGRRCSFEPEPCLHQVPVAPPILWVGLTEETFKQRFSEKQLGVLWCSWRSPTGEHNLGKILWHKSSGQFLGAHWEGAAGADVLAQLAVLQANQRSLYRASIVGSSIQVSPLPVLLQRIRGQRLSQRFWYPWLASYFFWQRQGAKP